MGTRVVPARGWAQGWATMAKGQLNKLVDPKHTLQVLLWCIVLEIPLNLVIIHLRPYTEIDWEAYMQEIRIVLSGELDYSKVRGGTGPLVYPAGFVYIFSALHWLTEHGRSVLTAQYAFSALYIALLLVVGAIYAKTRKCPPAVLVLMCLTSYRIHSIFVLRLFNDPVAMLPLYIAILCCIYDYWTWACVLFSFAVSIKMNVLLFAPGLAVLMLARFGWRGALKNVAICIVLQWIIGAPFLLAHPESYIAGAFDFGRVFEYKWTEIPVNWKVVDESLFLDRRFHVSLLVLHAATLAAFILYRWSPRFGGIQKLLTQVSPQTSNIDPQVIAEILFVSNFIGMSFSRSLHYQFYVWYYHSLPFLLWTCPWPVALRVATLLLMEIAWNTFPATFTSSLLLHVTHAAILIGLWSNHSDGSLAQPETRGRAMKAEKQQ